MLLGQSFWDGFSRQVMCPGFCHCDPCIISAGVNGLGKVPERPHQCLFGRRTISSFLPFSPILAYKQKDRQTQANSVLQLTLNCTKTSSKKCDPHRQTPLHPGPLVPSTMEHGTPDTRKEHEVGWSSVFLRSAGTRLWHQNRRLLIQRNVNNQRLMLDFTPVICRPTNCYKMAQFLKFHWSAGNRALI